MFTLSLVDLEYETSVSLWKFEMMILLNDTFAFILVRNTIKFANTNETAFINEI